MRVIITVSIVFLSIISFGAKSVFAEGTYATFIERKQVVIGIGTVVASDAQSHSAIFVGANNRN